VRGSSAGALVLAAGWPALAAGLSALAAGPAAGQLSPGPLAAAHQELDKTARCFTCHARGGEGAMDERCLACHQEVAWSIEAKRGLHGRRAAGACAGCHPDHAGRGFPLVRFEEGSPDRFDHRRAGFPLTGKHAALTCRACHAPRFHRSPAAARWQRRDPATSWLGLESACTSCHEDAHRGQLGTSCERCHTAAGWSPATGFDHARTAYPLTGRHAATPCAGCHLAASLPLERDGHGKPVARYRPLGHGECSACHRDVHAGRFGPGCARCHRTTSFVTVDRRTFDHDRTRYPLRGRHAALDCTACHDPRRAWGKRPAFAACTACHRDAHAGQATRAGRPADCAACHQVEGFRPSTFTVADHVATPFPLAGAHALVACERCHPRGGGSAGAAALGSARVLLRPRHDGCEACHREPHGGRFGAAGPRARAEGCLACHDLMAFRPSTMDVAAHARSAFPLEGAHRAAACMLCHRELAAPAAGAGAVRVLRFEDAPRDCAGCHRSPHGAQFAARPDGGSCQTCHGLDAFTPASRFDHDRHSAFRLEGAHARTPCASCHRREREASGEERVVYRPLSSRCESCHGRSAGVLPGAAPTPTGDRP
jgi:hypothetical protein